MIRAPRPGCMCEAVVQMLLHVIDNVLLEIGCAVAEQTNAGRRLFHQRLVAGDPGSCKILEDEAVDARFVSFRNTAGLFPKAPDLLARGTVGDTPPGHQVPAAEQLPTDNTEAPTKAPESFAAFRAFI